MPDPHTIRKHPWLRVFAPLFNDPNLLHFNRRSITVGVFCGVLAAFIPLPIQMFAAVFLTIALRGNLAVGVGFTWLSNPVTYIPLYYFCYLVGVFFLGNPTDAQGNVIDIDIAQLINDIFSGKLDNLGLFFLTSGSQLLIGCFIVGLFCAGIAYFVVGYLWRLHVLKHWKQRRLARKQRHQPNQKD